MLSILLLVAACQPTFVPTPTAAPTLTASRTLTPVPAQTQRPTHTPRAVASAAPTHTPTDLPTATRWVFEVVAAQDDAPPPITLAPRLLTQVALGVTPQSVRADVGEVVIGTSVEGRALTAYTFGTGERVLLVAGGMHGGWEANTVELVNALIDHFDRTPGDIPAGTSVVFVPVVNPDGLVLGRVPEGRFNANGVDLNRNWGCGWSPAAVWRSVSVSPGSRPFSEPETRALQSFMERLRPRAALFFHSAAGGVFAGNCNGDHGSQVLSLIYGEEAGYAYGAAFSAYPVTGTAASWADGQGIAAADVELATWDTIEFEQNLTGIKAVMAYLLTLP